MTQIPAQVAPLHDYREEGHALEKDNISPGSFRLGSFDRTSCYSLSQLLSRRAYGHRPDARGGWRTAAAAHSAKVRLSGFRSVSVF